MHIPQNDPAWVAVKHGLAGFTAWISSLGFSIVVFDEWASRISLVIGITVGLLTIISISKKLWFKK